jgi:hypothetical protein
MYIYTYVRTVSVMQVNAEVKLSLCISWWHVEDAAVWIRSFLTSALGGSEMLHAPATRLAGNYRPMASMRLCAP